jgi:hypothetical protein
MNTHCPVLGHVDSQKTPETDPNIEGWVVVSNRLIHN